MPLTKASTQQPGIIIPTDIRTTTNDDDYILAIDATTQQLYKITKADLLAGLSSSGGSSGGGSGGSGTSNTLLLSHFNGGNGSTTFSELKGHIYTSHGSPIISSAQSKFNGSSLLLDGSSYLETANSTAWNFASTDFNIELFFRANSLSTYQALVNRWTSSQQSYQLFVESGKLVLYWKAFSSSTPLLASASGSISAGNWYFGQVSKTGDVFSMHLDGSSVATATFDGYTDSTAPLQIGSQDGSYNFDGNIAELRISKAVQPATVPTASFPDS